jgi:hypothetical protein
MERHYGSKDISLVECINPRINKYRVRWDIQPYTEDNELEEGVNKDLVSFVESEYTRKPTFDMILKDVISSGIHMSLEEARKVAELLGEDGTEFVRNLLLEYITEYDKSSNVNSFYLNGIESWLDRDTRVSLMNSTNIQKSMSLDTVTLWLNTMSLEINCDLAIQMLSQLEVYALKCYNKTAEHKANVIKLEGIDEMISYDYTIGYPEKLTFTIE